MSIPAGGEGTPARGLSHDGSRAGHILCAICTEIIRLDAYRQARCWTDPAGITCAAHADCLVRLGEREIGLR